MTSLAERPILTALSAGAAVVVAFTAPPARAYDAAHPVVVELFQSQGCSSCPPANANVMRLSARPDVLALSFQVTYWDQLGWKDTFAAAHYTDRQWTYARALGHAQVWTPQVVVDGAKDVVGVRPGEIERVIAASRRPARAPEIRLEGAIAEVGPAAGARDADVWLVRYDPAVQQVPIKRGENGGKTLPHKNVVAELTRLGGWNGERRQYRLPPSSRPGLRTAILVQARSGGPILAAARAAPAV